MARQYYYKGKHNLRSNRTVVPPLTPEQLKLWFEYKDNPTKFLEEQYYITDPDIGRKVIELYKPQNEIINAVHTNRRVAINMTRQGGKTTTLVGMALHYVCFNPDKRVGIVSNKLDSAKKILKQVKDAYQLLPLWLQQEVVVWNKKEIELGNNTTIKVDATNENSLRGESVNFLIVDEVAWVKNKAWLGFEDSVLPATSNSKTSKIVYISTPNGLNHFYKLKENARKSITHPERKNEKGYVRKVQLSKKKKPNHYVYYEFPHYVFKGKDEAWLEDQKGSRSDASNDKLVEQNYKCKFLADSTSIANSEQLLNQSLQEVIEYRFDKALKIYSKPLDSHRYILGCDPATGKGKDYSAIQVLDITTFPFKQVASYSDNGIKLREFALIIKEVALTYNTAECLIENNNGGGGATVIDHLLTDYDYDNLIHDKGTYGVNTNTATKKKYISNSQDFFGSQLIELVDYQTVYQLGYFGKDGRGSWGGLSGVNDDLVMALLLALSITYRNEFDTNFSNRIAEEIVQKKSDDFVLLVGSGRKHVSKKKTKKRLKKMLNIASNGDKVVGF